MKQSVSVAEMRDVLNERDRVFREMLQVALTQLHKAQAQYAALHARYEALRAEMRRFTALHGGPGG